MRKRAFVHIGFPKTGTTTIQRSLAASRSTLLKYGLEYPGAQDDHTDLIAEFHPAGERHFYFERSESSPRQKCERLKDQIRSCKNDVIISSEYLHNIGRVSSGKFIEFLDESDFDPHFICYVRHPVDDAVSNAQQCIKMGSRSLSECIASPRYTKIRQNIEPFVASAGMGRISIKCFSTAASAGLLRDLFITLNKEGVEAEIPEIRTNESLSMDGAIIADLYQQYMSSGQRPPFAKKLIFKMQDAKFDLPDHAKKKIRELAQDDLDWLRETFGISLFETIGPNRFHPNPTIEAVKTLLESR